MGPMPACLRGNDVMDYKPAVTALSILFTLLVIAVAAVLGVYLFRRYRNKRSEPPAGTRVTLSMPVGGAESYDALDTQLDETDMYYGPVAEPPASSKQKEVGTYENTKSQNVYGNTTIPQTEVNKAGNIPLKTQNTYSNIPKRK